MFLSPRWGNSREKTIVSVSFDSQTTVELTCNSRFTSINRDRTVIAGTILLAYTILDNFRRQKSALSRLAEVLKISLLEPCSSENILFRILILLVVIRSQLVNSLFFFLDINKSSCRMFGQRPNRLFSLVSSLTDG